tara:strand:- start:3688 stop:4281 length:594 start_codon:yes stop_codon:yes gene_type:complete
MNPYFYHEQIMTERGIQKKDLPTSLKKYISKFNQKKRFIKDPDAIIELQEFSQILGEKISETEIKKKITIKDMTEELSKENIIAVENSVNLEMESGQELAEELEGLAPESLETPIDELVETENEENELKIEENEEKELKIEEKEEILEDFKDSVVETPENPDKFNKIEKINKINTNTPKEETVENQDSSWGLNFLKW